MVFSLQTHNFNVTTRSDKPKSRDTLQNNWAVLFKRVKVMRDKKRQKSYP